MPIIHRTGDIFTTELPAIGHGVNTQGLMGSGIAVTVRRLFPSVYRTYKKACETGELQPGGHLPLYDESSKRWILNIASQELIGPNARYELLESGVRRALHWTRDEGLPGLALPRIGAGIGRLKWPAVLEIIERLSLETPELTVELWTYNG